jgi:hypothetical protein
LFVCLMTEVTLELRRLRRQRGVVVQRPAQRLPKVMRLDLGIFHRLFYFRFRSFPPSGGRWEELIVTENTKYT